MPYLDALNDAANPHPICLLLCATSNPAVSADSFTLIAPLQKGTDSLQLGSLAFQEVLRTALACRSRTFRRGTLSGPTYPPSPLTAWSPPLQNAWVPAPAASTSLG